MIFYNFVLSICLDFIIRLNTEISENGNPIILHDLWWLMFPSILFIREVECATCKYWAALSCCRKYSVGTSPLHPNKMWSFSPYVLHIRSSLGCCYILVHYIGSSWLEGKDPGQRLYILQFVVLDQRPPATDG